MLNPSALFVKTASPDALHRIGPDLHARYSWLLSFFPSMGYVWCISDVHLFYQKYITPYNNSYRERRLLQADRSAGKNPRKRRSYALSALN